MRLILTKDQLIQNLQKVEFYLTEGSETEQSEMGNLIRMGACLVAYKINNELRFAPSRFVGYINNNIARHKKSYKDGKETNVAIYNILKQKCEPNENLKETYIRYCTNLGFKAANKKHKFWLLHINYEFVGNEELDGEFPEGKIVERKHKARERNSQVIYNAKSNFKKKHGKLFCEICNFDFENKYGELGKDFIEAHHTIAVSDMEAGHLTKPNDIAMLCSNCHKMIHKRRPWLTMDNLKAILKK